MNTCYRCANLMRESEGWERPDIQWWECAKRPGMANLRSFPFHNTKCPEFKPSKTDKRDVFAAGVL